MNVITAKAILGELLEAYDAWAHGDYFYDHGSEVCEAVECILEQPRWISVEERLPEDFGYYIVFSEENIVGEAEWDGHTFLWIANENYAFATHWMPLPEPPEVEG